MKNIENIRNFAIIAHIDHGKSTLADRMLEYTGTVAQRDSKDRMMDTLELEQEKGITIKLQTARMLFNYEGQESEFNSQYPYVLNLIDTPGHVDFGYEVSRSLSAAQGAVLLIDATQGIQAQTITNVYKALDYDLEIIPVINKIDLPNANVAELQKELELVFGFSKNNILLTSGKTGEGVDKLLCAIVERIPAPDDNSNKSPRALIFDSYYHEHKGVVAEVYVDSGSIISNEILELIGNNKEIEPIEIGYLNPKMVPTNSINTGEVGYIATGLKSIREVHVGDTLTTKSALVNNLVEPLPGYRPVKPMVFASVFPIDAETYTDFRDALEKLALNDAALSYKKIHSQALGSGFLCGYLGLLHMEVVQERLEREFDIDLITTSPSVEYRLRLNTSDYSKLPNFNNANLTSDGYYIVRTAAEFPDPTLINIVEEPWNKIEIISPEKYIGGLMELAKAHRGVYKNMTYVSDQLIHNQRHVTLSYEIPTAEIITTFFDKLKSVSQGYASLDYEFLEYRQSAIVKVGIMVNYEILEALSFLSHVSNSEPKGRAVVEKLKTLVHRQQFKIPIQAAINNKVIARETIQAYRKDVTAKLYGGDVSRKKKLLQKQKRGKKRMKMFGSVELPKNVFIEALKI
jgi:GTP-binding protein LepA